MSHAAGIVCYVLFATNPLMPSFFAINCHIKLFRTVLCEIQNKPMNVAEATVQASSLSLAENHNTIFKCASGAFMSKFFICDSFKNCSQGKMEKMICECYQDNQPVRNITFCHKLCHPPKCACGQLFKQGLKGGCEVHHSTKPHSTDVSSDSHPQKMFICSDETKLGEAFLDDLVPDCPLGEDEPLLLQNTTGKESLRYKCPEAGMHECYPGSIHCYSDTDICHYMIDEEKKTLSPCRSGKHLNHCKQNACNNKYKCNNSYCISYNYLCNGRWDCWNGNDENYCTSRLCAGFLKCRHSSQCVHFDDICNNILDCPHKDDEHLCDVKVCFHHCKCLNFATTCSNTIVAEYLPMHHFNAFVSIIIKNANVLGSFWRWSLHQASSFVFTKSSLAQFHRFLNMCHFVHLQFLDLSFNKITNLVTSANVDKSTKYKHLTVINLSSNKIKTVEPHTFKEFSCLYYLDLSHNQISQLFPYVFGESLKDLNLSANTIVFAGKESFINADLQFVSTEQEQICCLIINNPAVVCTMPPQSSSTCHRLLTLHTPDFIVWHVGVCVLLFNVLSLCWSLFCLHQRAAKKDILQSTQSFKKIVVCVNVSDLAPILGVFH